jgi:hypothetical protein
MKYFGTRPTYQIFAASTLLTGCIYFLFNKFYLRKRAMNDDNDLCKKKPAPADVECRETYSMDGNKPTNNLEVAKTDSKLENNADNSKATDSKQPPKVTSDNIDGGSDSGVDNPAYNDTEAPNDVKKEDNKVGT